MNEIYGNLWDAPGIKVVTTNGYVKTNGKAVMGRGCALEAAQLYTELPKLLGTAILTKGNHVHLFMCKNKENIIFELFTFPVKHEWHQIADLTLIQRSAFELAFLAQENNFHGDITLPRPGCGNGGLKWVDVKPVLEPILSDKFKVITFKKDDV